MADAWDGRPQNPERGGWHWVWMPDCAGHRPAVPIWWTNCSWEHPLVECGHPLFDGLMDPADAPADWRYLGPCLAPDEVAAREAAAAEAMREACAKICDHNASIVDVYTYAGPKEGGPYAPLARKFRSLPLPAADALARALDRARAEEREACAQEVDCGCAARADVLARLATDGEKRASYLCIHGDVCCALQAATIRAQGGGGA